MPRSSHPLTAFVIHAPPAGAATVPVVFDSPHSAIDYPADFAPAASAAEIRTTWDAYVDELCAGVVDAGATLIAANFPRAYIDANRAANDIDPTLLDAPWPGPTELSAHARRGMGLIRRVALPGVPMYARRLRVAEVRRRLDECYLPYRRALRAALDAAWRRHGAVWHFNCHSMKSRRGMPAGPGAPRADIVLGDRDGTTAAPALTAWVACFFRDRGYRVAINQPFKGADIVRTHGAPSQRRHSLQIEINRALYLDEPTCRRSRGFAAVRSTMTAFAQAVAARVCAEVGATLDAGTPRITKPQDPSSREQPMTK